MATFEDFADEVRHIEQEIARYGIVLGIDWQDDLAVRRLAREALDFAGHDAPADASGRAKLALFGLAQLMLKVMTESAGEAVEVHGGPVWKAFGRALWQESGSGRK